MKNIHTLPTNKPSRLQKNKHNKLFLSEENKSYSDCIIQNIYITSDEDIMIKDFYLAGVNIYECLSSAELEDLSIDRYCKKIILTTDVDLIKDGVQAIDDKFLEWFVKNPSCDEVEVERDSREVCGHNGGVFIEYGLYEILIPKEEPKQETLEEAAERYYEDEVSINAFINGYKLAQEQILDFLYSEITERRDYSASKMCEKVIEFTKNK